MALDECQRRIIFRAVHYLAIPEHPYYRDTFGWRPEDYPNALAIGRRTVSLPLSAKLTDEDVAGLRRNAQAYVERRGLFKSELVALPEPGTEQA